MSERKIEFFCVNEFSCGHMLFMRGKNLRNYYNHLCPNCKNTVNSERNAEKKIKEEK